SLLCASMCLPHPILTLFPYTTLFRSMHVVGQFRDLDDPDRFVWLRAFDSMPARQAALEAFYYGPVWRAHRDAANDTMIDSDDALDRKSTRLNSSHRTISYAVFCLKKK